MAGGEGTRLRPLHLEPGEADGADRRQAVHGAHPRAAAHARLRRRDRHRSRSCRRRFAATSATATRSASTSRTRSRSHRSARPVSVRLAADQLDEPFLVISGDALCDVDLSSVSSRRIYDNDAAVTIGLKSVDNPLEFGIVVTDEDGRIERFLEKPSWGQVFSDTINTGIYVLNPEVLRHVPTDRPYDFAKELFPLLLEMGRPLYGCVLEGYWQDIGNLDQYRQANYDALEGKVAAEHPRDPAARQHLDRRGRRPRRPRPGRGAGVHRQQLPARARGERRAELRARRELDASRARTDRALGHRRGNAHRPQRDRRRRDRRTLVRPADTRATARGRGDRRRGGDRRRERHLPRRAHLPVQGGRVRRADPLEPDLGVARRLARLRPRRRPGPHQRRPDARDGDAARHRARDGAEARREHLCQPRSARRVPHAEARARHRRPLDRCRRRRPPRASVGREPAPPEGRELRRRRAHRRQRGRSRGRGDPVLRAPRHPVDRSAPEGDREALHAPRGEARRRGRRRHDLLSGTRSRRLRGRPALEPRHRG